MGDLGARGILLWKWMRVCTGDGVLTLADLHEALSAKGTYLPKEEAQVTGGHVCGERGQWGLYLHKEEAQVTGGQGAVCAAGG